MRPPPVAKTLKLWKLVEVEGPHSGTVFVALAAVCFIVMVSTKTKWVAGGDGPTVDFATSEMDLDEYAEMTEAEYVPPIEMGQYLPYDEPESVMLKGGPESPSNEAMPVDDPPE